MDIVRSDTQDPDLSVERAVAALRVGGLVVFPTETFYGLGADPRSPTAVERLFRLKQRPAEAPILLLLSAPEQAFSVAGELPSSFQVLAKAFWPGPLTLVVPARTSLSARLTAGTGTIGLRQPGLAWPRALAARAGFPVTGTSANVSGRPPARTLDELKAALEGAEDLVDLLVDGGETAGGPPSTVVDLTGPRLRLIRAGAIDFESVLAMVERPR